MYVKTAALYENGSVNFRHCLISFFHNLFCSNCWTQILIPTALILFACLPNARHACCFSATFSLTQKKQNGASTLNHTQTQKSAFYFGLHEFGFVTLRCLMERQLWKLLFVALLGFNGITTHEYWPPTGIESKEGEREREKKLVTELCNH